MSEKTTKDRLKETEKLEAEIKRSLSVVGVKEAHKKIEDIEKLRKKSAILSIIERIDTFLSNNESVLNGIAKLIKKYPPEFHSPKFPNLPLNDFF